MWDDTDERLHRSEWGKRKSNSPVKVSLCAIKSSVMSVNRMVCWEMLALIYRRKFKDNKTVLFYIVILFLLLIFLYFII